MSDGFQIIVDDKRVVEALASLREHTQNLRPLMGGIGTVMIRSVHQNFEAQGRPSRWKPRSVKTMMSYEEHAVQQARRTKKHQNAKTPATKAKLESQAVTKMCGNLILQRSGALKQKIILGEVTNHSVEIGSSLPYARIHQLGGTIGAHTVRARRKRALLIPTQNGYIFRKEAHIPQIKIPARPYLVLQQHDLDVIAAMAVDYLERGAIG
ncbi:phage virion morphogenesis protein [Tumebacillus sp. ITR2]|uniref:Phage virion morphogenesis protein n=1 Tax=Tumebacillus amylolyticus TaxID=2801339 RepID=A0ABS1JCI0_9BACL|nr:phage virion morphogenesis protein [Tumebacillus amylolyticus]MBL0387920.1 phage virion morphogenesis protein [Tumebacillus amylolyticus]